MKSLADDLSADLHATSNPRHRQTRSLHQATNRKTLLRYEENPLAHAESLRDSDLAPTGSVSVIIGSSLISKRRKSSSCGSAIEERSTRGNATAPRINT